MESLLTIVEWAAGRWLERRATVLLKVEDALPDDCGAELLYRREPGARGRRGRGIGIGVREGESSEVRLG